MTLDLCLSKLKASITLWGSMLPLPTYYAAVKLAHLLLYLPRKKHVNVTSLVLDKLSRLIPRLSGYCGE